MAPIRAVAERIYAVRARSAVKPIFLVVAVSLLSFLDDLKAFGQFDTGRLHVFVKPSISRSLFVSPSADDPISELPPVDDGTVKLIGRRLWFANRSAAPHPPHGCQAFSSPALIIRSKTTAPGLRPWEESVIRPIRVGEDANTTYARLLRDEPSLFARKEWRGEVGSVLSQDAIAGLRTAREAYIARDPSATIVHSLYPLENQTSPLGWPESVSDAENEDAVCGNVASVTGLQPSYASRRCSASGRLPRRLLDPHPTMGGGQPIDMRLPPWHKPPVISAIPCGMVLSHFSDSVSFYVVSPAGGLVSGSVSELRSVLERPAALFDVDEAATIGVSRYLQYPGHLPNENLPRLLYLDAALPPNVPIIYPFPVPHAPNVPLAAWFRVLREAGAFGNRSFLDHGPLQHAWRARTLYALGHDHDGAHAASGPYASFMPQNAMAGLLRRWARRILHGDTGSSSGEAHSAAGGAGPELAGPGHEDAHDSAAPPLLTDAAYVPLPPRTRIIILRRRGPRELVNHAELAAAVRSAYPSVSLQEFEPGVSPGYDLRASLLAIANATLVISPHGAGSNNILAAPPGAALLELGVGPPHARPGFQAGFNALARVIGVRYFYHFVDPAPGEPDKLHANVPAVMTLVRRAVDGEAAAGEAAARDAVASVPAHVRIASPRHRPSLRPSPARRAPAAP